MSETPHPSRPEGTKAKKKHFSSFTRRTLLVLALAALAFLLWRIASVLLLVFLGILLAILLDRLADALSAHTPLSRPVALLTVGVLLLALIGLGGWLVQTRVAQQLSQLPQQIQQAVSQVRQYEWGQWLINRVPSIGQMLGGGAGVFSRITGVASRILDILTGFLIVIFLGVYLAADPGLYERGFIQLLPERQRSRAREALGITGRALWLWLLVQFLSMAVIGFLVWLGLTILGIPLALTLGIVAGLLEFIPTTVLRVVS